LIKINAAFRLVIKRLYRLRHLSEARLRRVANEGGLFRLGTLVVCRH